MLEKGVTLSNNRRLMASSRCGATTASVFAGLITAAASVIPYAAAQEADRQPFLLERLFGQSQSEGRPPAGVGPDRVAQNPSELIVRLDRLEAQIRQLTGTIEQLQFRNQQLEAQLRRMQDDAEAKGAPRTTQTRPQTPSPQTPATGALGKRGDAFDPALNPNAPGVPQTLGTIAAGPGQDDGAGTPGGRAGAGPLDLSNAPGGNPNTVVAVAPPGQSPKDDFDVAYSFVVRKDFTMAEDGFRNFLKRYPTDRLSPEATYWLGESMFQRQQYRDAAEAFLNVSTKYESSGKAPDALFRLGQSLAALGEKEAACASLGEITRKFPKASAALKQSVEREQKRVRC
jgi:tol-pal system protein YbgF